MDIKQLCFTLSDINGTSGDESGVAQYIVKLLSDSGYDSYIDTLGNVIAHTGGNGKKILLVAHMDQVGLVVRGIDEKGFVLIDKVGGPDVRILTGAEVTVHGKKDLYGVVCSTPPHLLKADDKKAGIDVSKLAVDVGYSAEQARKLISIGDRITMRSYKSELAGNLISCPALDNRASVAAVLAAIESIKDKIKNISVNIQFSVQEEVGLVGAKTGAFAVMPDEAIVIDVGFGNDPYTDKTLTVDMGKGPSIGICPTLDKDLITELTGICKENNIPYQHDVMNRSTGTDADSINICGCGVKTALLSVPLRYMHTAIETVNTDDIEYTAKLLSEYLLKREAESNA